MHQLVGGEIMRARHMLSAVGLSVSGALLLLVAALPASQQSASAQAQGLAVTNLVNQSGAPVGVVVFTQQGPYVRVTAEVNSIPPGFHGFHVHAVGVCDASTQFMSAGGHFNPGGMSHSDHAGDMPSLYATMDGAASASFTTDRYAAADLFDADGSAVIVHADKDNFANIPARYGVTPDETTLATGDAGARIACGVIQRSGQAATVRPDPDQMDSVDAHGAHHAPASGS
jgi:Cu-Zn family superoxide dismutase